MEFFRTFRIVLQQYNMGGGITPDSPRSPRRDVIDPGAAEERREILREIGSCHREFQVCSVIFGLAGTIATFIIKLVVSVVFPEETTAQILMWVFAVFFFLMFITSFYFMARRIRRLWHNMTRVTTEEMTVRVGFPVPEPAGQGDAAPIEDDPAPIEGERGV